MKTTHPKNLLAAAFAGAFSFTTIIAYAVDPLPSWNDGPAKRAIISFAEKVTKEGSPDFVPAAKRIATFDNDGTLWCEKMAPVQLYFMLDRVKALAPQHRMWEEKEPFASLLKGDVKAAIAGGEHSIIELVMARSINCSITVESSIQIAFPNRQRSMPTSFSALLDEPHRTRI